MMREQLKRALFTAIVLLLAACGRPALQIDFEKYTLDNGLEVILHEDHSDPIVSVAVLFHVGSNREEPGRTGFAHLFEHILFEGSENVPQGSFEEIIYAAGGTYNGFTWEDGTMYFEVVPRNALETVLWMESDRMGYTLSAVTQEAFEGEQAAVQNEKRRSYDNRPYGYTDHIIGKTLYPEGHPYNWQTIGAMEDVQRATLQDVRDFFLNWYGPNNATLVIAGDIDGPRTRALVEKYFGDIKPSEPVAHPEPWHVSLDSTRRVFHEDNFAQSPELNMVFPTVQMGHRDDAPLDLLAELLADGKRAPLYKVIVEEKKLAPGIFARKGTSEITGAFNFRVRTFPGVSLAEVEEALMEAFERFETEGFSDQDMARIKANTERVFYNSIASVYNKSFQLAWYNEYYDSPAYISQYLENYLQVTREDVMRVYNDYLQDKPYALTSFVPNGQIALVAEGSERFPLTEETIAGQDTPGGEVPTEVMAAEINPTSFDRSIQPPFNPDPGLQLPTVWHHRYENGMILSGIRHDELPLVQFSITMRGGLLLDSPQKVGVANMVTDLMMEGTRTRTPLKLEEAIDELGSSINMITGREVIVVRANTLASKFKQTYALVEEILLEPRWDETEFERHKKENLEIIHRNNANPTALASNTFRRLIYGPDNILGNAIIGTSESVSGITIDDLTAYYAENFSPSVAHIAIVGDISKSQAVGTFKALAEKWPRKNVPFHQLPPPPVIEESRLYFVDVPQAKQSEIRIGYPALSATDPDYYPAVVMNYKLGYGPNGFLESIIRGEKGYTYAARSYFSGGHYPGPFVAYSGVRTNVTYDALLTFREILSDYAQGISEDDLAFTKDALIKSNARRFETLGALTGMLNQIMQYDLPDDYIKDREHFVKGLTLEEHQRLARRYIDPGRMIYLVVGDAATQLEPLRQLGLGEPIVVEVE